MRRDRSYPSEELSSLSPRSYKDSQDKEIRGVENVFEIPTLSLAMLRRKKVWPEKRGKQRGMRNQGCEGQVDPCSRACSLPELSRWQAAPCLGDFRHPASPRTLPRNLSFRSLEIPSLSALPTLSRIPPSPFAFPFLSLPFLSSRSPLLLSFGRVETIETEGSRRPAS